MIIADDVKVNYCITPLATPTYVTRQSESTFVIHFGHLVSNANIVSSGFLCT